MLTSSGPHVHVLVEVNQHKLDQLLRNAFVLLS